ncbi:hypothetical protein BDBG_02014 [Blastomyces gilchristii SLH14081]|uniref:Uncharacterized protein n=1 Tax=Blastomyces gilchristii (strain SLH14081) TaxID=559298 RepID=A0A179UCD3_BLAGS|nr:uncharacterized protein BDBG_02014 [Blastomyces gilchristii SLH14081]OAT05655.1 hypothetical protein BDBG_02014 [Blastomyces gilchristii SLH14081]
MEPVVTSVVGPDSEFHDPERVKLIGSILRAMRELEINAGADPGTWLPLNELVWSCIWLSDIERLADLTSSFEKDPSHIFQILYATFSLTELGALWTSQRSTSSTPISLDQVHQPTQELKPHRPNAPLVHVESEEELSLPHLDLTPPRPDLPPKKLRNYLDSLRLSTAALPEDPSQEFTVEPPSFPANLGQGGRECVYGERPNIRLFNCEANELISSGQVITLTTEDPESLPLPDLKLLDLQWKLHRVLALVAAAGYNEDEDENYDDDDRYGREPVIVSGEEDSLDEYEKPWAKKPFESHTSTTAMGII